MKKLSLTSLSLLAIAGSALVADLLTKISLASPGCMELIKLTGATLLIKSRHT